MRPLARSELVSPSTSGNYLQRMKLLEREGDLADVKIESGLLRLKYPAEALYVIDALAHNNFIPEGQEVCHNFHLSVNAEREKVVLTG